ncbi:glutamate receptor ionotropic, NMDA 1 [Nematostella vectensis]|uniref:glutamate receptor ionotropic, NMDA 1 n=1 Tax=Nematostella vectensis TaxID=45351 RepID=UPI0020770116|nr:glutamate receptor ionotropic, NMDA 1 [Nematostella vectensis]
MEIKFVFLGLAIILSTLSGQQLLGSRDNSTIEIAVIFTERDSNERIQAIEEATIKFWQMNTSQTQFGNWRINFKGLNVSICGGCSVMEKLRKLDNNMGNISFFDGAVFLTVNRDAGLMSSLLCNAGIATIGLFEDNTFASQGLSSYFTRMRRPHIFSYAYVMKELVLKMGWRRICLVASADQDGVEFAGYVKYFVVKNKWKLISVIWIDSETESRINKLIGVINDTKAEVVMMYGRNSKAQSFFQKATTKFSKDNLIWLITEHLGYGLPVDLLPTGILRVNHRQTMSESQHLKDVDLLTDAFGLFLEGFKLAASEMCGAGIQAGECLEHVQVADFRRIFTRYIRDTSYQGISAAFAVTQTEQGKPKRPVDIWNLQKDSFGHKYWTQVGLWTRSGLALDRFMTSTGPVEPYVLPPRQTLRVPIVSTPVWTQVGEAYKGGQQGEDMCMNGEFCYMYNSTDKTKLERTTFCCVGTQIDLIKLLERDLNFNAEIYFVPDGKWGTQLASDEWNGLMNELVTGKGDITAFLGISSQRLADVEFTQPYFTLQLTILVKTINASELNPQIHWNFQDPFHWDLWVMVIASCNIVLVVIWALDRMSPRGHRRRLKILQQGNAPVDNGFTLLDSMSYVWGVAFSKDIGAENTPRGPSARFVSIFFAFMALILVNTYCANLTAFLLEDNVVLPISGVEDRKLLDTSLYPPDGFQLGVVQGSFEEAFFKNHNKKELQLLYNVNIKINLVKGMNEGFDLLQKGKLDGLVGDEVSLQSQANVDDCKFSLIKKSFYNLGVAFAFPKGSPWASEATLSVLKNQENGTLDQIRKLRFPKNTCQKQSVRKFGIADFSGLFVTVVIVIAFGLLAVIFEVIVVIILMKGEKCLGKVGVFLREFVLGVKEGDRLLNFRELYSFSITEKSWNINKDKNKRKTSPGVLGYQNGGFVVTHDVSDGVTRRMRERLDVTDDIELEITPVDLNPLNELNSNCINHNRKNGSKK